MGAVSLQVVLSGLRMVAIFLVMLAGRGQRKNQSSLLRAAAKGHEEVVKLLLEKDAELETKDEGYGRTPLLYAARNGHESVVKLLLEKGAKQETKDKDGQTPLSCAARNKHEAVVKLLLEKAAELETKDEYCIVSS